MGNFRQPHSLEQWTNATIQLMPTGVAWVPEQGTNIAALYNAFNQAFVDNETAACDLLDAMFPATTDDPCVSNWENTLNLPDPYLTPPTTLSQRQALIVARLTFQGSGSIPFIINYAAAYGYVITVKEYGCWRAGQATTPPNDPSLQNTITIICSSGQDLTDLTAELATVLPADVVAYYMSQ